MSSSKPGSSRPTLVLLPDLVACGVHRQIFKPEWPKGWAMFTIDGLKRLNFADKSVAEINTLLREKPMCCRLEPEQLRDLYMKCGVGKLGVCEDCGKDRYGVPFDLLIDGQLIHLSHMCFRCIAFNVKSTCHEPKNKAN